MPFVQDLDYLNLVGFSQKTVETMHARMRGDDKDFDRLMGALALAKNNFTWDSLTATQGSWTRDRTKHASVATIRRDFAAIGKLLAANPIMEPTMRFSDCREDWPGVTCMADGIHVETRWRRPGERKDANFDGKHKCISWKFFVFCSLFGIPFHFMGPFPGKEHDSKMYMSQDEHFQSTLFEHAEGEFFLGDLGLIGNTHFITMRATSRFCSRWCSLASTSSCATGRQRERCRTRGRWANGTKTAGAKRASARGGA
jgi:hypothetical protein